MALFGICPYCSFETEVKNVHADYCMCNSCNKIYNIMGHAKIQGTKLSEGRMKELNEEIEKDVSHRVNNWRII